MSMPLFDAPKAERLTGPATDPAREFSKDVRRGLTQRAQKEIPAKYLYDALGSALFEAITLLPEYGLTRADFRLTRLHARDVSREAEPSIVIELGSGSSGKARPILEELAARRPVTFCPIDLSIEALRHCKQELAGIKNVDIRPLQASYLDGLRTAIQFRDGDSSVLTLFLGSSIGNFAPAEAEAFCRQVKNNLSRNDTFLVSTDLEKEEARMLAAYDDAIGVTAAFNLNILGRMNRELQADFNLAHFKHLVRYSHSNRRVEMHLRSEIDQLVTVGSFSVGFRKGETIWTESSYKFHCSDLNILARAAGFKVEQQWVDSDWPFAQTLMRVR